MNCYFFPEDRAKFKQVDDITPILQYIWVKRWVEMVKK